MGREGPWHLRANPSYKIEGRAEASFCLVSSPSRRDGSFFIKEERTISEQPLEVFLTTKIIEK
jgi:hypothetical protein